LNLLVLLEDEKELTPVADILINKKDNFLIIDEFNHRVQIYDEKGKLINSFGEKGKEPGQFYYPKALAQDSKGNLYIADCWNHRIQKFSPELQFLTAFGSYGNKEGEFNEPYDITIDKRERLFIVDRCNHRIQVFDSDGKFLYSFGQRGTILEEDLAEFYETPKELFSIPAFEFPTKIALDTKENLYVVDSGNCRIQILTPSGEFLSSFGEKGDEKGKFQYPFDIAIDTNDNIFVSDPINSRINKYTPEGLFILSLKGIETDDNSNDTSLFTSPSIITFDKKDRLIISEDLSAEVKTIEMSHKPTEEIYREKLLLVPNNSTAHHSLATFYSKKNRWNEAVKEYALALNGKKDSLDIKIKLAGCISKADFSESHLEHLDKIMDFTNHEIEALEKEIIQLYGKKREIEKELQTKSWEKEWEILIENKSDIEIDIDIESKNRRLNRSIRERLVNYKKITSKRIKHISLLLQLCDKGYFNVKKEKLINDTINFLKKDLNCILKYLNEKSHLDISAFFTINFQNIQKIIIQFILDSNKSNDFLVRKQDITKSLINIFLNLNNHLLGFLRERKKIYSKLEKRLNSNASSDINFQEWLEIKTLYNKLGRFNYLILSWIKSINELIVFFNRKIFKEFKAFLSDSSKSFLPVLVEINWLVWESENYITKNEIAIDDFTEAVSSFEDKLIEQIQTEEDVDDIYFNKVLSLFNNISFLSDPNKTNFNDFINFLDKEMDFLSDNCEHYKNEYNNYIEKHAQFEDMRINNKNLSEQEVIKLKNALERVQVIKQLNGSKFNRSKKALIIIWKRIKKIIENYLNTEKSIEELLKVEEWINKMSYKNVEKLNRDRDEVLIKLLKNQYHSENLDFYKRELENEKVLFEKYFEKVNQILITLKDQVKKSISTNLSKISEKLFVERKYDEALNIREKALKNYPSKIIIYTDKFKMAEENIKRFERINNKYFINHDISFGGRGSSEGEFYYPTSIKKDIEGNLLISDRNYRIQKFSMEGEFISSFGVCGTSKEELFIPVGLAVDKEGFIYVCNISRHCIEKFSPAGEHISSFGKYGSKDGEFKQPTFIAIDLNQDVYISDFLNHRIQKFSSKGEFLISFNLVEKSKDTLHFPTGIFVDKNGDVFVGEHLNGQIHKMSLTGEHLLNLGKQGIREKEFISPLCFVQDSQENIYISDFINHRIQKFSKDFEFIWLFGTYGSGKGEFSGPVGMEIIDKYLYVCDQFNHRIQRFKISE